MTKHVLSFATALVVLALLQGCTAPWTAEKQKEERAGIAMEEALEAPKKFSCVVIARSTARQFSLTVRHGGDTDQQYFHGPVGWLAFRGPLRKERALISLQAQFNYSAQEQQENHEHSIEYWEDGILVMTRYGRGPGVSTATMAF